jgi:hypothetical protein
MTVEITPETRVADLLAAYPALEDVLIRQAACFAALKHPVLRKTVARVATLQKAAQMAGLPVRELVATLREAAGLPVAHPPDAMPTEPDLPAPPAPAWVDEGRVAVRLDADALLAAGEVPLTRLNQALRQAGDGLVCLVSSFRPTPLVETLERAGHQTWMRQLGQGRYQVYIRPR